jgi:ubiquinone/menaquinone biosynthesis C-methylase UbiE
MGGDMVANDQSKMKHRARHAFDAWAGSYDRSILNHFLFRPSYFMFMEEISRWHHRHPGPFRVLDIGCGTGSLAGLLADSSLPAKVTGLDYSPAMCERAQGKAIQNNHMNDIGFVAGDSEHLPFADQSFDVVTCSNSFHHYPHQQAVVHEMHRLLRPGGRLMLIDGFRDNIIGWVVFDVIIAHVEEHVFHAPWSRIREYFVEAGFSDIRHRKFDFWFPKFITVGSV